MVRWPRYSQTMVDPGALVQREQERALLQAPVRRLASGQGGVVLVSGESGVGKTALVETVLAEALARVVRSAAHLGPISPYAPLLGVLGNAAAAVGGADHPEAAVHAALRVAVHAEPTVLFLDDLHWADAATLELLERWAPELADEPVLLIGSYRSEGLGRRHPLRRLRAQLRRGRALAEIRLAPLDKAGTAALVGRRLGDLATPALVAVIHERAKGVPFNVEALADAVAAELPADAHSVDAGVAAAVIPDRVHDAVLLRLEALTPAAVELAEVAAAAGTRLRADIALGVAAEGPYEELRDSGLVEEATGPSGQVEVVFRHALVRDALYAATPWGRRRAHHRRLAALLEAQAAGPQAVAGQWLAAGDTVRAREWLVAAAEAACTLHAYSDAYTAISRALRDWPPSEDAQGRRAALELLAGCAERCGELDHAVATLAEIAAVCRDDGDDAGFGDAQRRLSGVHELRGDWPAALGARAAAAAAFDRTGRPREAAVERLAAAGHLHSTGQLSDALALVEQAGAAVAADDGPLRARVLGLEGLVRAKLGDSDRGVTLAGEGLRTALAAGIDELSAEAYYLWADALEQAARYTEALDAWSAAFEYCQSQGLEATAHVCLACLVPPLRHTGQWEQAVQACRDVFANPAAPEPARMVAAGELGLILAARGETKPARRHLNCSFAFADANELFGLEIDTTWGLARVDELEGRGQDAAQRLSRLVRRCAMRQERHYAVAALRWSAAFFAERGLRAEVAACTDALSRIANATGAPEALAALSCAHGETALLDGDPARAAAGFERALELVAPLNLPPETAEIRLRCGVALVRALAREQAVARFVAAYHTARKLRARPLAQRAANELAVLGEDVAARLGRRAAGDVDRAGLSRRELEVLHLVAEGLTNREIGQALFVSTRTVDMHVRNLLAKLACRGRAAAARRAAELGLLKPAH